tara:strand:- start:61 stop:591 length:531 start_codon:yes stop_codon:yes gene_type:complete
MKKTTKQLLGEYYDLEMGLSLAQDPDDRYEIEDKLVSVKKNIRNKVEGIDRFLLDISKREHLIDAEIEAIKQEQERLKLRKKVISNMKNYFNNTLLPLVIEELGDENGVYESTTSRYKLYETDGPVIIENVYEIADTYKTVKHVETVNKKLAREHLKQGFTVKGMSMNKVKRVRRT